MDDKMRIVLGKKASNVALIVNICLMLSKVFTGFLAHSTAIIADAFNNGTDIFATLVVFGGLRIAYLPPDEKHHYGHAKAESVVSKIVALIIMLTGFFIGWSAVKQIISFELDTPGSLAIYVSAASILAKFFLYKYTNRIGNSIGSSSIVADSYNHRSDVLASLSAMVGIAGARLGYPILDPIAGIIVSAIILKTGISIYIDAIESLMDTAPNAETIKSIEKSAENTRGVIEVNDLKARKHGAKYWVDLKICVDKDITVEEGHNIASNTKANIINNIEDIANVLVHVNPCHRVEENKKYDCINCKRENSVQ
ncbi:putative cation efflux system proteinc [Oxobacter pfennigii]|uniref:Putative cation efflux system proteinc n=1 Tax=Oxobacter pfennigii TaxID=36849 RepID=A0A0N8NTK7_9CLOT|nr:cation diffusion facilitator family transporter [Oxobacter pfennigii]KPU45104.1 putative cation efflux system proteinc [Oxobacter pfennigii]